MTLKEQLSSDPDVYITTVVGHNLGIFGERLEEGTICIQIETENSVTTESKMKLTNIQKLQEFAENSYGNPSEETIDADFISFKEGTGINESSCISCKRKEANGPVLELESFGPWIHYACLPDLTGALENVEEYATEISAHQL